MPTKPSLGTAWTVPTIARAAAAPANPAAAAAAPHSNWLSRADLMAALEHFGWQVKAVAFDTPDHPHGPALALVASKS